MRVMRRPFGACLAFLLLVAACAPAPDRTELAVSPPPPAAATLTVIGAGSFECGQSFHGCTAWFVVRPKGWQPPAAWSPGLADTELRPTGNNRGNWLVAGRGGPGALAPGAYTFAMAFTEVSDTEPYVLGTDERPGSGILNTTVACTLDVTNPPGTGQVTVFANFGPVCRIDATLDPAP
jgi:hypothetical protein